MDLGGYGRRGRRMVWANTCTVKRSTGDVSGYDTPATVHSSLDCSRVYEYTDEEREKGFLTTVSRPLKIFATIPDDGVIQEHDKVVINSKEYLVVKAKLFPHEDPSFYELMVDYQR